MSQKKSIIELVGLGTMMSWTFIDENEWSSLQREGPERDELLEQLIDKSLNDNVFSGCYFTEAQLFINGELVCETFTDITDKYAVTSHPAENLIEFSDKPYCFVQDEVHRGAWGCAEVYGEVDHSKLHFHLNQSVMTQGHYVSLDAEYDGVELDFGDTATKSGDWYVVDRKGHMVTPVETYDSPEPDDNQPATATEYVPMIKPFGFGDPEYERNEAIAETQALIDQFELTSDEVFGNDPGIVANDSASTIPAIQQSA